MNKPDKHWVQVGSQLIAGLFLLPLCVLVVGCSLAPPDYLSKSSGRPSTAMVADVPFFAQDDLQCGPASLAMVLQWSGVAVSPAELSPEVYTPGLEGSLQHSLIGAARRHGRIAYPIAGADALMAELAVGHPVIVLVNLGFSWYPQWHYAVAIGYDQDEEVMILHSGLTAREAISFWTFDNIWQRADYWGLLVLSPDRLPGIAEEDKWLRAVAGLENTEQWQAAATGYTRAVKRWDKSFIAWMGLGSSSYHLGDLDAAADAFHQATLLHPDNGMAHNNLAHVLAKQGKLDEALSVAQRAVKIGGPSQDTFRQTLAEIQNLQLNQE